MFMKHERIILVGLGYIIGFVTAFIGFGLTNDAHERSIPTRPLTQGGYGLVERMPRDGGDRTDRAAKIDEVLITNDGLFASMGGEERIVSAGALAPEGRVAGFHYAVIDALVSPSGEHLFYCVLLAADDRECRGYVYHAPTDSVYPVKDLVTDSYLVVPADALEITWTEEDMLVISGRSSISSEEPWMIE